ncbi:type II toxin-antitoxin system VapC family toxin [Candidatus Palauibacter sp.]|uniref:type II toxin-antitoxin system VapC family toxin n=1 Tax=Candidatus Palauibacter sp. TaxID=3101350 RepID=UPI003AF30890
MLGDGPLVVAKTLGARLLDEPDGLRYRRAIVEARSRRISAATLLETAIVAESKGGIRAGHELDRFIELTQIEVVPVTLEQAAVARDAWRCYGKGSHAAGLNLGDCFAYALARTAGEPLLFKGRDFALTDIEVA